MIYSLIRHYRRRISLYSVLIALLLFVYLPYLFHGGFIVDDWGQLQRYFITPSFPERLQQYVTSSTATMRPVQGFLLTVFVQIFKYNPSGYILTSILFWVITISIITKTLRGYIGTTQAFIFFILASIPVICSSTIFSPVTLLPANFSFFLWALSFYFTKQYIKLNQKRYYIMYLTILIITLLTYEIVLPLFLLNLTILLMSVRNTKSSSVIVKRNTTFHILAVICIIIMIAVYQKAVVPLYAVSYSRLHFTGLVISGVIILSWIYSLVVDTPLLLFSSLNRLPIVDGVLLLAMIAVLFSILWKNKIFVKDRQKLLLTGDGKFFFGAIVLTFISNSIILVFSGYPATIYGYTNRMMSSTYLTFCILLAVLSTKINRTKFRILIPAVIFLFYSTMIVLRNNYIDSWRLQKTIISDAISTMRNNHLENVILIGNVPLYTRDNFINAEVFSVPWDFGAALSIADRKLVVDGFPITEDKIVKNKIIVTDKDITIDGYWKTTFSSNLWYYEYNQNTGISGLQKIKGAAHFTELMNGIRKNKTNEPKIPDQISLRDGIIQRLRLLLNRPE